MVNLDELIAYMRGVQLAERELRDIGAIWQLIESSAEIGCPLEVAGILPTLVDTRERFQGLTGRLVELMVRGQAEALAARIGARAQCAIDILVRNLYERTADVGFLATDDGVRDFCATAAGERPARAEATRRRLAEYQAKYTVYDDIVLLGRDGELLLRLSDEPGPAHSADPVCAEALAAAGYVQRFGPTDLGAPGAPATLRFAHRVADRHGRAVGVLVLRFHFADEMARIFASIDDSGSDAAVVLVDEDGLVVASADAVHVPLGTRLRLPERPGLHRMGFAGRDYLAVACDGNAYQGYAGLRWRALAMVSLLTAFRQPPPSEGEGVPLDSSELMAVQRDAETINRELRRVVWNGRLHALGAQSDQMRFKAVLRQVTQAGGRTRERLRQALLELSRAELARTRDQALQLARLAADIMDRNLYERANDCRWWALAPVLREGLAAPGDGAHSQRLAAVLDHINGLYTVYSRLVLFDAEGRIRAASRLSDGGSPSARAAVAGQSVPGAWLEAVRNLGHGQQYAVSEFEDTALHDHGPTYTYLAAVRAPDGSPGGTRLVGGIAVVFNAQAELLAMLRDVMGGQAGCAAFIDEQGRVLAATDPALARALLQAPAGESGPGLVAAEADAPQLVACDGRHHLRVQMPAAGYREFKRSDGYDNRVRALVALPVGLTERRGLAYSDAHLVARGSSPGVPAALEAAVFQVAFGRYALPSEWVADAVPVRRLAPTSGRHPAMVGLMPVGLPGGHERVLPVLCARRLFGIGYAARQGDGVVLLLRPPGSAPQDPASPCVGLRVDDVLTVLDAPGSALLPAPWALGQGGHRIAALVDCQAQYVDREEPVLVQLLEAAALFAQLTGSADEASACDGDAVPATPQDAGWATA